MPVILRVGGYRLFFFSNEGREPPHVHIEGAEGHAKFWLRPVALARSAGYTGVELARLGRLVEERREELEAAWHDYFGS